MSPEEKKPLPSIEMSAKYASWSLKEMSQTMTTMQQILDQKLSEITTQLREIGKTLVVKDKAPF
jgi:hypothetical protein